MLWRQCPLQAGTGLLMPAQPHTRTSPQADKPTYSFPCLAAALLDLQPLPSLSELLQQQTKGKPVPLLLEAVQRNSGVENIIPGSISSPAPACTHPAPPFRTPKPGCLCCHNTRICDRATGVINPGSGSCQSGGFCFAGR